MNVSLPSRRFDPGTIWESNELIRELDVVVPHAPCQDARLGIVCKKRSGRRSRNLLTHESNRVFREKMRKGGVGSKTLETYEEAIKDLVHSDGRFIIMTAENRAAIRNLPEWIGERFIDVGICEQTMIGAAAGLALRGRIPVVHALATFLTLRAFEFIRTDVGIPGLPVKLVGSFSGFISEANGPTHQALEDIALMRGIPNINLWCPVDEQDMLIGLKTILTDPVPYYFR